MDRPYNALLWFDVSFSLYIGGPGYLGGAGLSVCLGNLPDDAPFDEDGAGHGLRVVFRSQQLNFFTSSSSTDEFVEVWHAGELLHSVALGKWLRTSTWVPVRLRLDERGFKRVAQLP